MYDPYDDSYQAVPISHIQTLYISSGAGAGAGRAQLLPSDQPKHAIMQGSCPVLVLLNLLQKPPSVSFNILLVLATI